MHFSDSHIEFIHHPEDKISQDELDFLNSQATPLSISKIKDGLLFAAIYVGESPNSAGKVFDLVEEYRSFGRSRGWNLVLSKKDLARKGTKMIIHLENLAHIKELVGLDKLYRAGVRSIGLTHNQTNQFAGGCMGNEQDGLTELGQGAIKRMLDLGIILDLAHLNQKSFIEIVDSFKIIPFVSHTGISSVYNSKRNITDSALKSVKRKNGYVGISLAGRMLSDKSASPEHFTSQVFRAQRLTGITRVGLGSDLGGVTSFLPRGIEKVSSLEKLGGLGLSDKFVKTNLIRFVKRSHLSSS